MSNLFKKVGLAALVLLILLIIALAFVALSFDPNDHKDRLAATFHEETGYTLHIKGDIAISFYPWLGIEINQITIDNATGFGDAPLLHADKIGLRIKTLPLLKRKYELDTLHLHGAVLNLLKNEAGETNWGNFIAEEDDDVEQEKNPEPLAALILGGIDIRDTSFSWSDQTTGKRIKISAIKVETDQLVFDQPINIKASLQIESHKPDIKADMQLQGTALYDTKRQTYAFDPIKIKAKLQGENIRSEESDVELNTGLLFNSADDIITLKDSVFSALGTHIYAQLDMENIQSGKPKATGELAVDGTDLAHLFKVMGEEQLVKQLGTLQDQSFKLKVNFNSDMEMRRVMIPELQIRLADTLINGHILATNIGSERLILDGELRGEGQNLPVLLQLAGTSQLAGDKLNLSTYGNQLSVIADKKFAVDIKFDTDLAKGNINVPRFMLNALGLSIDGRLKGQDINNKQGEINGQLSITSKALSGGLGVIVQYPLIENLHAITVNIPISGKGSKIKLGPLQAEATIINKHNSSVKMSLNAVAKIDMDQNTLAMEDIRLSGAGLNMDTNINLKVTDEVLTYSGDLNIAEFNLRKFMREIGLQAPITADKKVLSKLALQTKFSGSKKQFTLDGLALSLDDTKMDGNLLLKNFTQPIFNTDISINSINIDRYLPPPSPTEQATVKETPTDVDNTFETLRRLKSKAEIKIGELILAKIHLQNVQLGVNANDGLVKLQPIQADIYEGKYQGHISLDVRKKLAEIQLNTQLDGLQIAPLLQDYTNKKKSYMSGVASFNAQLSSQGEGVIQLKHNLGGQAKLNVNDGMLRFQNLSKIFKHGQSILSGQGLAVAEDGQTKYNQLTANININEGAFRNDDLQITGPGFKINGGANGKDLLVNLRDTSIDYGLNFSILKNNQDLAYSIFIGCKGSLNTLLSDCRPDYTKLIGQTVKSLAKDKLKKIIGFPDSRKPADQGSESPLEQGKKLLDKIF